MARRQRLGAIAMLFLAAILVPTAGALGLEVPHRTLLVFGDSLSAGYGVSHEDAWVTLLGRKLASQPATASWEVVNASISGETTHGGTARIAGALDRFHPDIVILELGGNDALRGTPIEETRRNLESMAQQIQQHHARLVVVGIALPPNYGDDFTATFAGLFSDLAKRHHAALLPNLVESLGTGREQFQADGIHPLGSAQPKLLASVWRVLEPLLKAPR